MSAWVVSKAHVDLLVTAGLVLPELKCQNSKLRWTVPGTNPVERRELTFENADSVGVLLWAENVRSVDHRYPDDEGEDLPGTEEGFGMLHTLSYKWEQVPGTLDPVAVIKAVKSYEYQSCEHPGWETSQAHAICEALTSTCINQLPGYAAAPWAFDDRAYFTKRVTS